MALTRKEFEELAGLIATLRSFENERLDISNTSFANLVHYTEQRLISFCKTHGHNFNEKRFREHITQIENILNEETAEIDP